MTLCTANGDGRFAGESLDLEQESGFLVGTAMIDPASTTDTTVIVWHAGIGGGMINVEVEIAEPTGA